MKSNQMTFVVGPVLSVLLLTTGLATAAEIKSPYEAAVQATGKSPRVASTNQFVLIDTLLRYVPAARTEEKFPGLDDPAVVEWRGKFKDGAINFPDDGFRTVFTPTNDSHYNATRQYRSPEIPDSWLAPVNFYDGKIHYRVEVMEKPNTNTVTSLLCRVTTEEFHGTHNVWFGHGVVVFREPGLYHFEQPVLGNRPFIRDTKFRFDKPLVTSVRIVAEAQRQGMLLAIAPAWSGCCGEGWAGRDKEKRPTPLHVNGAEKSRELGRWLGKRYGGFDNLLWLLGGDNDPNNARAEIRALGLGLKDTAPQQLVTYHAASTHSSTDVWPGSKPKGES